MAHSHDNKADSVLQQLNRYQSGRLTLFLGAAPGVGKTYAMLVRARELIEQQQHVLIAYIETHGRVETEKILQGLPVLPRKQMTYQGHLLEEMDLDAVLLQQPAIVLIDELAHQNIPGSRHEKRWQDINELLDAGIDVFTTMNIQHLESLNDVVFQITGVRVKETVPDLMLQRIRDIRLIDLPVSELLERLHQGKVYVAEQIQPALHGFFNHSHLTALRELAIQTVADHVDVDARENFVLQGQVPIPLNHHILVFIDHLEHAEEIVRVGCRLAEKRAAKWTVVAFTHGSPSLLKQSTEHAQNNLQQRTLEHAFALARQMGGMTEMLYGEAHAKILQSFAVERGISTLVLAQVDREYRFARSISRLFSRSVLEQLLKSKVPFEISVFSLSSPINSAQSIALTKVHFLNVKDALLVVNTSLISIFLARLGEFYLGIEELSVIFITAVVFVAARTRMLAAVCAAIILFLAYNFVFIEPRFTLQISARQGVITVLAFLAAALIASRLASRLHEQVIALKAANRYNSIMQDLGLQLSVAVNSNDVLHIAQHSLAKSLDATVWLQLTDDTDISVNNMVEISEKERISATWTLKNQQASGRFTQTLTESEWWFLPLLASKQCLGVLGLQFKTAQRLSVEQKQLAEAMIDYIAQALLRTQMSKALELAKVTTETEKLRSALLSSVSHDLRSPLAAMIGAAESMIHYRLDLSDQDQNSLLETIQLEGERLDRYIQNLLDMTRLGHEGLSLKRDWVGVDELVGSAVRRLNRYMPKITVHIQMSAKDLSVYVHAALIEQAIFNVLENAAKFSPDGVAVEIDVYTPDLAHIAIAISDQGVGIPEAERQRIFDMFYTMQRGDRGQLGTGLGLTIVKAIIGAHQGEITATAGKNQRGTRICMCLPIQQISA